MKFSIPNPLGFLGHAEPKPVAEAPAPTQEPKPVPTREEWAEHIRFLLRFGAITNDTAEKWLENFGHMPKAEAEAEIEGPAITEAEPPVVDVVTAVEHAAHDVTHHEEPMAAAPIAIAATQVNVAVSKTSSFLYAVGHDLKLGLDFIMRAMPVIVPGIVAAITPMVGPAAIPMVSTALTMLQNAIVLIERDFAAQGKQDGTGAEKSSALLIQFGPAVKALLSSIGLNVDDGFLSGLTSILVGLMNIHPAPVAA